MTEGFSFYRCPEIIFGAGSFREAGRAAARFGRRALVITGAESFKSSGRLADLLDILEDRGLSHFHAAVSGEPSPDFIDVTTRAFSRESIDVVIAAGGGSAIDAGKAVSAMLPLQVGEHIRVEDFIEDTGTAAHPGCKVPFIAVPTTAGTGSEATKNAVLCRGGPGGFKKSLRHDNLVPDVAVVDPELLLSCPVGVTAACGMDAFTQLLESYVSTGASPLTDALALSGLEAIGSGLPLACSSGAGDVSVRAETAYASLLSGITLANAGLGAVHGFAAAVGGLFDVPHGVVCGTLVGEVTRATIRVLEERGTREPALEKYAMAGALLGGTDPSDVKGSCAALIETIEGWTSELAIPRLGGFGMSRKDVRRVVELVSNKNNPVELATGDLEDILLSRI